MEELDVGKLPKIELHCHLDGSIRPSTIVEMASKDAEITLPTTDLDELIKEHLRVPEKCESLGEYLTRFELPGKILQTKEGLSRAVYELMEDAESENIKYIEIRFAPNFHVFRGLTLAEIVEGAIEGLDRGEQELGGIRGGLLLCSMRHLGSTEGKEIAEVGAKYLGKGVVGMDLAGGETPFPPELHRETFDLARELGHRITIHAGETGIGENVLKSVELLHAERIGHGIFCKGHPPSLQYCKDNDILLEVCPTSNLHTKAFPDYASHPIKYLYQQGIKLNLSTDNRTVSGINLTHEYQMMVDNCGFTKEHFKKMYIDSVNASFATQDLKDNLLKFLPQFD